MQASLEDHEDATAVGFEYMQRYIPPGTVVPRPPTQEMVDAATLVGNSLLGRYDPQAMPEEGGPPFPDRVGFATLVARAYAAFVKST